MKPIKFKHCNIEIAKSQDEYETLHALIIDSPEGYIVSCWKLSFKERIKILFIGKVWLSLMSFNKPLTPSFMSVNRKDVYSIDSDKDSLFVKIKKLLKSK